jgi:hypothetical protein
MTRTHRTATSWPQAANAATIAQASSRRRGLRGRRRFARRELLALPAMLALLMGAAPALAQAAAGTSSTGTSGYNQKPPTPTTTTEAKKEVEHSNEKEAAKTTPTTTTEPAVTPTTPTTTTAKASTLPFTGLNLTWVLGAGVLLLAAGLSIRLALRTRASR